ncbi:MAG TPA: TlpA disulfide reductase family protein [Candidatus Limnocylindrales bacterium]|nr:TlpA disulfide reductase family protein [Candidatus Limnocylindrales bacterium]
MIRIRLALAGVVVLLAAVVAVGLVVAGDGGPATATPSGGGAGLELAGADPVTGDEVSLSQFAGKPVVLNFWASWCPGCYAEARALVSFAGKHPEAQVVGINFQDTSAGAREFHAEFELPFPSIADPNGAIGARLRLQGMPTTIFLDAEHREVARIVGETDEAGFEDGLRQATGG